jgi:hypothetical protein
MRLPKESNGLKCVMASPRYGLVKKVGHSELSVLMIGLVEPATLTWAQ